MKVIALSLIAVCCALATDLFGQAVPLDCASEITGDVIDFEQPANAVNEVLQGFDMMSLPDEVITTLVFWITGSTCAPISNQAGFSDDFVVSTTGDPWTKVGVTVVKDQDRGRGDHGGDKKRLRAQHGERGENARSHQ